MSLSTQAAIHENGRHGDCSCGNSGSHLRPSLVPSEQIYSVIWIYCFTLCKHYSLAKIEKLSSKRIVSRLKLSGSFFLGVSLVNTITEKERESFLDWISTFDFEKVHDSIYAKKHEGTGDWLIQTEEFRTWFSSSKSSLLWCYGKREYNPRRIIK